MLILTNKLLPFWSTNLFNMASILDLYNMSEEDRLRDAQFLSEVIQLINASFEKRRLNTKTGKLMGSRLPNACKKHRDRHQKCPSDCNRRIKS